MAASSIPKKRSGRMSGRAAPASGHARAGTASGALPRPETAVPAVIRTLPAFLSFRSIRAKTALFVIVLLAAVTAVTYAITLRIIDHHVRDGIADRAESLGRSIASAAGYSLLSLDRLGLDNLVYKIRESNPDIDFIAVVDPQREIIVHSDIRITEGRLPPPGGPFLRTGAGGTSIHGRAARGSAGFEIESPIIHLDRGFGTVVLGINGSGLAAAMAEARKQVIAFFAAVLACGLAGSLILSSRLTRPVTELMSGVAGLKGDDGSRPLRVYSADELGRLTASFNEMTTLITDQRARLKQSARDLEEAYVATIRVLAAAIDARDGYTLGHSNRVAELAVGLARALGLGGRDLEDLEIACLFHDVGKIRIPDAILHKRGRLNPAEAKEMRRHPEYGAEILSKAPSLYRFIPAVRHHHEWFDGSGYPDGLSREKIPAAAAIISLADAFDAMTSDRPYRKALTPEEALAEIRSSAGRQFDPEIVRTFVGFHEGLGASAAPLEAEGRPS